MDEVDWDDKVQVVAQQIKHQLIAHSGKTEKEASDEEFYRALSCVLREEVMLNWTATQKTHHEKKSKRIYYISLEWLTGRMMANNVINMSSWELVQRVLKYMNRDIRQILREDHEPGLGNGGLGRLAACFLDSMATMHYPSMGYGLRYQYGIFEQELWYGFQVERPDPWLLLDYPWEVRLDAYAQLVHYNGRVVPKKNKHNEDMHILVDYEDVRALPYDLPMIGYGNQEDYSVSSVRIWSTKGSPRNFRLADFNEGNLGAATLNSSVTDVLYPNDQNKLGLTMRIRQEYLLVTASLKDIFRQYFLMYDDLKEFANIIRIQINDTHPALVIAELMRLLTHDHEVKWAEAWEMVNTVCSYTNHTVLKESLEVWDSALLQELLPRQFHIIQRINFDFCNQVRSNFPNDERMVQSMSIIEDGGVQMARLAIVAAHAVNGVAALHSRILQESIFPEFNQMFPDKFTNVTNGVTQRRWILMCNPDLAELITDVIGDKWITDLNHLEQLHNYADDSSIQERFHAVKLKNKKLLLDKLCEEKKKRYGDTVNLEEEFFMEGDAIFDVQVKRIHEYKRQLMNALSVIMLMQDIKKNPDAHQVKTKVIMAGKAAPGYDMAKNIIRLFYILARIINTDPILGSKLKVIFVENYNVSWAERIIPAADFSSQISTAGQEASGTSNMKFTMNGAITIGTEDGANVEIREAVTDQWWPGRFGKTADEIMTMTEEKSYKSEEVLTRDPEIKAAVEMLVNGDLAENEVEHEVLKALYDSLLGGEFPDKYFVLEDLRSYYDTKRKAEDLYLKPDLWAQTAIHNIAASGIFSSDESIKNYANNIWGIQPVPIDKEILKQVQLNFKESDRCFRKPS